MVLSEPACGRPSHGIRTPDTLGGRSVRRWLHGALLALLWLAVPAVGFGVLLQHQYTAGDRGPGAAALSDFVALGVVPGDRATVVVAIHPRCPCANTTLEELRGVLDHAGEGVRTTALFVLPAAAPEGFERGEAWDRCATLPGVERRTIREADASGLGPRTSGHVLAFGPRGDLLFDGGITLGRGHAGDNDGRRALAAALAEGRADAARFDVFGCGLFDRPDRAAAPLAEAPHACCEAPDGEP